MNNSFVRDYFNFKEKVLRWMDRINAKPSYPWLNTSLGAFLTIPGLRALWPMGAVGSSSGNGRARDITGDMELTINGSAQYTYDGIAPCAYFDGSNDYLSRADETRLDIIGTESYIVSANRGLTMGGWFKFINAAETDNKGLISKWPGGGDNSYMLYFPAATDLPTFIVSDDGTTTYAQDSISVTADTWYFLVGRYRPSTSVDIYHNGVIYSNTTSIPASLNSGAGDLLFGAYTAGAATTRWNGRQSMCFLSAMALTTTQIQTLYEISRGMFGV